jgi:signal transduction histidine kinase/HAMP domain-containing protein
MEKAKAFSTNHSFFSPRIDYTGRPLFARVKKSRTPDTGEVYEKQGTSFFDILYPLENGQFMLVAVRWDLFRKLLFDQEVGKSGSIWVLDEKGRVIGDSREAVEGKQFDQWPFFRDRLSEFKDQKESDVQLWKGEFADPSGKPIVGSIDWVKSAGWYILSVQPQTEAYAEATRLRRSAFLWMLCSFLGVGFFAYFWVQHISTPISRLAAGVKNVTRRRFEVKVPEDFGLEEFRALGKAFNQMMQELASYEAMQVEKIIEEKTTVQSLLFSIQDGILMVTPDSRVVIANAPARQWTIEVAGRSKGAFETAWQSLQEYPPWTEMLIPVLENEKENASEEFEFPVQGRNKWSRVMAQQVLTEGGRRLGVMIVIRDITQDKELERMKEDFFNGITHDLRTPLAATIGYLGLCEGQVPEGDGDLSILVGSARQSAKRALSLVETILSLARLQAGKLTINPVPVNAQGLVKKIVGDLSFQADAKKIALSWVCEDPKLWALADASLIERVLENLTGNAIKYTMENGWVKVSARPVAEGVEFAVLDNGRGIPPEALEKLFGKFQQVKAEDRAVGFGIGLAFSKGIVEAHGSSIAVVSAASKGSNFFFVLERTAAPAQAAA